MVTPRTKSLSTKVTETEYMQVQALAGTRTVSEWARGLLLRAARPDPTLVLLAEVLALRTILLNLHFAITSGSTITSEQMQAFIDRADQQKWDKAEARLAAASGTIR
jgi:hypothetical protein